MEPKEVDSGLAQWAELPFELLYNLPSVDGQDEFFATTPFFDTARYVLCRERIVCVFRSKARRCASLQVLQHVFVSAL